MMKLPSMVYGTAWKKDTTESLVSQAFKSGFIGVDTATQPKHYFQPGVGAALKSILQLKNRDDIWIQTKFTSLDGQDLKQPLPYDKDANVSEQVRQSLETSFKELGVDYLDALLLHSPLQTFEKTKEAWLVLEEEVDKGRIGILGISNCYDPQYLKRCFDTFRIKPSIIQNRFYAATQWEKNTLAFLESQPNKPILQTFWTLTANPELLASSQLEKLRCAYPGNVTKEQALYIFLMRQGICPLNGTTNSEHMKLGVQCTDIVQQLKGRDISEEKPVIAMLWG